MCKKMCDMIRGDKIRNMRDRIGLSQDEAASRMHISRQSLSSIENGGDFRVSTLIEMMKVYGVTSDEIITDIVYSGANEDIIERINRELEIMDRKALEYLHISLHSLNQSNERLQP